MAKSSVAPATIKEYIKTDAYADFQKYVRKKEKDLKWYQPFDEDKYIDLYADQFMVETGRQETAVKIAARNPEIIKRRQEVEKYAERQKKEAEYKMEGAVQDFRDIHSLKDLGSYIGTMGGQAAYQIPLAILTRGSSSLLQESAEVYDQQIGNIARDKGISREEVITQGLDEPAAGQAYAILAASLDAASAGNILKAFRVGARDGLLKRWAKTAVPEALTEPTQGVLETMGGATGDKLEAAKEALTDPNRINEVLGGLIGGGAGVFAVGSSPAQIVKEQTEEVDINNEQAIDQKANVIQNTVEANESSVNAGQQDTPVITPVQNDQETQVAPAAPTQEQEGIVSETLEEEEITPKKSEETTAGPATVREQIDALVASGDVSYTTDNRVKIETEKGGQELQRIFEENKVSARKVEEDTEPKTVPIYDEDTAGGSPPVEGTVQHTTEEGVVEATPSPADQQAARAESVSGVPQLTSEELTFTRRVRDVDESGGIEGVKPHNQFKLNQGPYPRVHVLLSDADADLYMEGVAAKRHPGKRGRQEAIEFAQKVNRIAKEQRDKDNEVVLDFRQESLQQEPQQGVADGSNISQQPVVDSSAEQLVGIVDSGNITGSVDTGEPSGSASVERLPPTPPPPPTKQAAKKEPSRSEGMRTTWARIKDDPNISPEIKEGISKEAKVYIPRSLSRVTEREANAIIDANGLDESMDMYLSDATNEVHPDVDTAIGIQLFDQLQKANRFDDAARVFEKLSIRGTELGQAVNAFKLMQGKTMAHL
ncbi:MAG: hypothetical protein MN733_41335, partial [Nitrososphaera sp.]|nr:hypothetical protein [Nitrososphaera sp.]